MLSGLRTRVLPATLLAAATGATLSSSVANQQSYSQADAPAGALDPKEWKPLKLTEKEKLTGNTYRLRFQLPDVGQSAGLSVASCLLTRAFLKGPGDDAPKAVIRPYTPTSPPEAQGYLDLVVKAYPQGKMSKHLGDLCLGQTVDFKGPLVKYPYVPNSKKYIGMIAGGSGITPMLQVIDHIMANVDDDTKVSMIYANVSEEDIILKDHIDTLEAKHPNFKVFYVVDKPKTGKKWLGGAGYINESMLRKILPPPSDDILVMVCGPPGMMNHISGDKAPDRSQGPLSGLLLKLGYNESMVLKF